jgi:hypothetical protein
LADDVVDMAERFSAGEFIDFDMDEIGRARCGRNAGFGRESLQA